MRRRASLGYRIQDARYEMQDALKVNHAFHPCRRAFTLIELLLAISLASILLVSAAGLLLNLSELYFTARNKPDHDMHVRNVTHFMSQVLDSVSQPVLENPFDKKSKKQSADPIQWSTIPGDSMGEKDHLSFQYSKSMPIIYWETGPLPAITAWIHHEPDQGLFLLWQTNRQAREDPDDYMKSLISPYVTEMHYQYYDAESDEWEEDKADFESNQAMPKMIQFVFEWSEDERYETNIIVPQGVNGAPIY